VTQAPDALDIELSHADFEDLDPTQLKQIHDKLRQSRRDVREERDQIKERLAAEQDALARMTTLARHATEQAQQRDARLSRVAMRMIDAGMLDLMQPGGQSDDR